MEDESPNDYLHITRSGPLLMKVGDSYVIGCIVSETNEMTAEHRQYHEIIDHSPPEKDVFKMLLEKEYVPRFNSGTNVSWG